jgi:hypothetical protein
MVSTHSVAEYDEYTLSAHSLAECVTSTYSIVEYDESTLY